MGEDGGVGPWAVGAAAMAEAAGVVVLAASAEEHREAAEQAAAGSNEARDREPGIGKWTEKTICKSW
jgi:hypothetical protein